MSSIKEHEEELECTKQNLEELQGSQYGLQTVEKEQMKKIDDLKAELKSISHDYQNILQECDTITKEDSQPSRLKCETEGVYNHPTVNHTSPPSDIPSSARNTRWRGVRFPTTTLSKHENVPFGRVFCVRIRRITETRLRCIIA